MSNPFSSVSLVAPGSSLHQSAQPFSFGTTAPVANDAKNASRGTFAGFSFATPETVILTDKRDSAIEALTKQRDERMKLMKKAFASKMRERYSCGDTAVSGFLGDLNIYAGFHIVIEKPLAEALHKEETEAQQPQDAPAQVPP